MVMAAPKPSRRSTREASSSSEYHPQGWVDGGYQRIAVRGLSQLLSLRWDKEKYWPRLRGVRKEACMGYAVGYSSARLYEILVEQVEPALIRHGLIGPPPSDVKDRIGWDAHFQALYGLLGTPFSQLDRTTANALRGLPFYAIHVTGVYNLTHHAQDQTAHALQPEDTGGDEADTVAPTQLEGTPDKEDHGTEDNTMEEDAKLDRGSCSGWLGRPIKGPAEVDGKAHMVGSSKDNSSEKSKVAPPKAGARAGRRMVVDLTGDSDDEPLVIYIDD